MSEHPAEKPSRRRSREPTSVPENFTRILVADDDQERPAVENAIKKLLNQENVPVARLPDSYDATLNKPRIAGSIPASATNLQSANLHSVFISRLPLTGQKCYQ